MSFKCVSFDKTYASKSSLTRHQKTHDGAVFKCEVCSKIYQRRDYLVKHVQIVHRKTMESMRKRMKMELLSCERRFMKLVNCPTFKYCTTYNENLAAVSLHNKIIDFCKPINIGFAVFDISKTLMYDYHYNVMKRHYRENIQLLYTDTNSLV
ncbi:PR domain zinc finger protein 15-like [Sipha flava]|uniref:PR domain zinc finger protein 15-like n=1 Tax=Sipha flava TaxID=143950 RepID=A0A8B8FAJ9_9HEMI|nr:PR domain zinc finger protein 15-like [Sipha flava]